MEAYIYNYLIEREIRKVKAPVANGLILTISRQFGTQTRKAAEILIDQLNKEEIGFQIHKRPWKLIDYTVLHNLSKELKVGINDINEFTPIEYKGIIDQIMYGLDFNRNTLDENLTKALRTVILSYFERGNVIFLGRGAVHFASGVPNVMKVNVRASEEYRIQKYAHANQLDFRYAKERVREKDRKRRRFNAYISEQVPIKFDLVIDREELSDEGLSDCLLSFVKMKEKEFLRKV
ncbi:cytidylate kinase-like family protein [Flammeovirga yaeyamensis]|uniref:Cytidylate kinase-like family protein n=1 Tax=Flammeovirga yaeyamensis TaxID=367791 RepID=A0AAX1N9T3_9BACT|nr:MULTISPECIES: cytidylate kinase family protein [Flammeovirga]ANQ52069.2 cytidylate kinase-like family protein [Flammeovirga sp. MY04]MBB3699264.1 cytidylate kinase [Flammeovirga yaeyamensis]NMF35473.1 cytidylate kinase-like family protein [Flammeovirga yaeyamensis]QWG04333.1 cytidylate kinase-like family protein [Flammeovirga yaeyamensis]